MNDKVMVIRYDDKPPRQVEWKGEFIPWMVDKCGFPIIITSPDHAKIMCMGNPDRYRYYRSPKLDIKVNKPDGTSRWEKLIPWSYEQYTIQTGTDPENGEQIIEKKTRWFQDEKEEYVVTASEEFITGKVQFDGRSGQIHLLEKKTKSLEGIVENQKKMIEDQSAQIAQLMAKLDQVISPKPGKGKSK